MSNSNCGTLKFAKKKRKKKAKKANKNSNQTAVIGRCVSSSKAKSAEDADLWHRVCLIRPSSNHRCRAQSNIGAELKIFHHKSTVVCRPGGSLLENYTVQAKIYTDYRKMNSTS